MSKILLDYVFPVSQITPTPEASTAFLKQVCLVCKPKSGQEGNVGEIYECSSMTAVGVRTDNTNAQQLFNAGMSKVYILLADDLDLETPMDANQGVFFTLLVSDDFDDTDFIEGVETPAVAASLKVHDITFTAVTAGVGGNSLNVEYIDDGIAGSESVVLTDGDLTITVHIDAGVSTAQQIKDAVDDSVSASALVSTEIDPGDESAVQAAFTQDDLAGGVDAIAGTSGIEVGTFKGVIGFTTQDSDVASDVAAVERRVAFLSNGTNKAKNMCYAFGSLLSNQTNWNNQQYIPMPYNDDVDELGEAESLFDDKVSFVIHDDEFSNRLGLFAAGHRAIVAPYIVKNLIIDMQSAALSWISGNQPQYTKKNAALLETRLQEDVINAYILRGWIEAGIVEISLEQDNFVAAGDINVAEPKALWRVFSELRQTL